MLESDYVRAAHHDPQPRASLIVPAGDLGSRANIWMGGAHSLRGVEIRAELLASAWLVDTAGDMPASHRVAASEAIFCVFVDTEDAPSSFWRIEQTVTRLEQAARGDIAAPPDNIYIVCTHGMNRSGLLTGLVLGRLGLGAEAAMDRIRLHRPGALSNHTFQGILRELHP